MRLSYGSDAACPPGRATATRRAARSMPVTSASSTETLRYLFSTSRVGGATWPDDRIPVATW